MCSWCFLCQYTIISIATSLGRAETPAFCCIPCCFIGRLERRGTIWFQALTTRMNESPTNHKLKYSQAVNVKSIPVQADISEGPASTTGTLIVQVRYAIFSNQYVSPGNQRWSMNIHVHCWSNVFIFLWNLSFIKRIVGWFGTNLIKSTKLST